MQTATNHAIPLDVVEPETRPRFNVVTIYEDLAAGKHAKVTYDHVVGELGEEYEFSNQYWNFEVLQHVKMREMAELDAESADLIIIATHRPGELPAEVKAWLDACLAHNRHAMALVTLADQQPDSEIPQSAIIPLLDEADDAEARLEVAAAEPEKWPVSVKHKVHTQSPFVSEFEAEHEHSVLINPMLAWDLAD